MFAVYHSAYLVPINENRNGIDVHVDVQVFGNDLFNFSHATINMQVSYAG